MNPGVIAAAQSVANLGTSILNNYAEDKRAQIQRQWNEQMIDKQNAFSLDMWNRTNEYNSPTEQVKRLESAGLNPLYYGLDGQSANGFESASPLGYQRAASVPLSNPVTDAMSSLFAQAQIENLQANTAKQSEETKTEVQRRESLKVDIDKRKQEIENLIKSGNLTDTQVAHLNKQLEWIDRLNQANIEYSQSQKSLNDSQRKRIDELLDGEKLLQSASLKDFEERWNKLRAEVKKLFADTELTQKDIDNYMLIHMDSGYKGTGISLRNLLFGIDNLPETGYEPNPSPGGAGYSGGGKGGGSR